jgi:hypothetical protein
MNYIDLIILKNIILILNHIAQINIHLILYIKNLHFRVIIIFIMDRYVILKVYVQVNLFPKYH